MRPAFIPHGLRNRPFTAGEARAAGLTDDILRGSRFRRLFRGVYLLSSVEPTFEVWLSAATLILPKDAIVSHLTALRLYGLAIGPAWPLHFSTRTVTHSRQKGIEVHRRKARVPERLVKNLPITGPDRTLIDIATKVGLIELIQAADWMLHARLTTLESLAERAMNQHLDGVRRVRASLGLMREGVESPMETVVRLMLVFARLPHPSCNADIRDAQGRFIARGDLVYFEFLVLVEYDGWHHERDGRQRQRDRERREALEGSGWRVIVVTSEDLKRKREVVHRVHAALVDHGYEGRPPHFNVMWDQWFA